MSRFDKLFKDISQRSRHPNVVEFALTEMLKLCIKYMEEENEKVVASISSGFITRRSGWPSAGDTPS